MLSNFKKPASGFVTWVDFSRRMKAPEVSDEDWNLFFNKYGSFIIAYCRRRFSFSDEDIADLISKILVDEVFQKKVLQKFSSRGKGSFRAWFSTMIQHKCIDFVRARDRKEEDATDPEIMEETVDEKTMKEPPEDKEIWDEYIAYLAIEKAAEKSTNQQIECFLWRCRDNRKPAEIAAVLGITAEQVSEAVRSFKDKVLSAMKNLGEKFDMESVNWKEFQQKAESAREKYLSEVNDFSIRMGK